ncbi:MAG: hypothetical protein CMN44_09780 [SAR116 cluster bacterium]|nr:hypothetical protein [SAR116 cluster bacterium]RPH08105.1 MAG: DUF1566 domain-containing protein [Alphaproteobacteria bacterium TMED54]|tara:strand:- start:986 stop:1477 length:492 start_codon:yes stop_codon:yes gene_type:complete
MYRLVSSKFLKFFIVIFFIVLTKLLIASDYIPRGYYVIDLKNKIEWMTCPVGMVWKEKTCFGIAKKYELKLVPEIVKIANEQLDGNWRLPKRIELESLICKECSEVKINLKFFPKTPPEPFWSSDKNFWQPKYNWIVNFFNGNTFGRYPSYKPNYVRLVRDRN